MALSHTPSLAEVMNHLRGRWSASLRVSLPARVERYDSTNQLIDAKPLIKDRVEGPDGEPTSLDVPVITNVPVLFPGAGGFHVTFPVNRGDTVLLVFTDRSLDAWLDRGGLTDPDDARRHHISDAVALLGLHSNRDAIPDIDTG